MKNTIITTNSNNNNNDENNIMSMFKQIATFQMHTDDNLLSISDQMKIQSRQLGVVTHDVDLLKNNMNTVNEQIYQLQNNEEITTNQRKNIRNAVNERVKTLFPTDLDKARYRATAYKRCYSDMQRSYGMATPYETTPKCMYQSVMDGIVAWIPHGGVEALKREVDEKAKAKKQARDEGYDC